MIIATAADPKYMASVKDGLLHSGLYDRCKTIGVDIHFERLESFSWRKLLLWEQSFANRFKKDKVVFVDAADFVLQGSRYMLEEAVPYDGFVYHSEAKCWPEPHKEDLYPPSKAKNRFVNGTGPAGKGEAIADAIAYGLKHFPIKEDESSIYADNDQRFLTDLYLAGFGKVDEQCKLSVQMNGIEPWDFEVRDSKIWLKETGTMPCFAHFNGAARTNYADALREVLQS